MSTAKHRYCVKQSGPKMCFGWLSSSLFNWVIRTEKERHLLKVTLPSMYSGLCWPRGIQEYPCPREVSLWQKRQDMGSAVRRPCRPCSAPCNNRVNLPRALCGVFWFSKCTGLLKTTIFQDHRFSNKLKTVEYTCPKTGHGIINFDDLKKASKPLASLWAASVASRVTRKAVGSRQAHAHPGFALVTGLSSVCLSSCLSFSLLWAPTSK